MSDSVATEPPQALEADSSGSRQRHLILVVGGLAALLVVGLGAYFLFLSGGSEDESLDVISSAPAPAETDEPKGDKKDDDTVTGKVDDDIEVGRDPFKPLPQEAVKVEPATVDDTDSSGTDTGDTTTSTGGGGTQPTKAPTVNPTPTPAPSPTETKDPVEETSYKVILRSVDTKKDSAVIEVDGKRYVIKADGMFPSTKKGPFKLVRVDEPPTGKVTATVRFGSDAPVELLENDKTVFTL